MNDEQFKALRGFLITIVILLGFIAGILRARVAVFVTAGAAVSLVSWA